MAPAAPASPSPTPPPSTGNITSEPELHALDRALVVLFVDPDAGTPLPATALRTVVVVAYIEV